VPEISTKRPSRNRLRRLSPLELSANAHPGSQPIGPPMVYSATGTHSSGIDPGIIRFHVSLSDPPKSFATRNISSSSRKLSARYKGSMYGLQLSEANLILHFETLDYELVRVYHPDALQSSSLSPESRHKRFQSIAAAYDILRGKTTGRETGSSWGGTMDAEIFRRKKAFYKAASAKGNWDDATYQGDHSYDSVFGRERWKSSSSEDTKIDGTLLWGSAFVSTVLLVLPVGYSVVTSLSFWRSSRSLLTRHMLLE
jgi:hypothetical protein